MKILLLHQHFNSPITGGAMRSWYLATALVARGVHVTVITGGNQKKITKEIIDGIEVYTVFAPYQNQFGFGARINSFLRYVKNTIAIASRFKSYDRCYAMSVPLTVGLAAMWIRWRYKIPYIFEVGDIWPEAPIQLGFVQNPINKFALFQLEKMIYRRAESLVALSPSIQAYLEEANPDKKIHLIPNFADCDFFAMEQSLEAKQKWKIKEKFVISYIGAIGFANGLEHILACAEKCRKAEIPIQFLICGEGAVLNALAEQGKSTANVRFIPFQNRDGVKEVMSMSDAVFISYRNVPILETGSPNKFFDGLASGKLIIINFNGWIKDVIEAKQCGLYISTEAPESFPALIAPFLSDQELLRTYQQRARTLAEENYSRNKLSEQFARIFLN